MYVCTNKSYKLLIDFKFLNSRYRFMKSPTEFTYYLLIMLAPNST